jgi:spore maturation protein SpmB
LVPEGGADGSLVAPESAPDPAPGGPLSPPRFGKLVALSFAAAMAVALALRLARGSESAAAGGLAREVLSFWILPMLIAAIVLYGWVRGVKVYSSLVEGAKEGFSVAIRILPYLVAILVMVGLFRASGGMELLAGVLGRWTEAIALPAEAVPMALLRPLSGSGAYGLLAELLRTHGPDSYIGYLASTLQGSTETTFYVLAVYFGAVGIRKTRHAVPACLLADAAGISAAVAVSALLFGSLR